MNIFVLDNDPVLAAQYLCDKHVPKMLLETAQLLCNPFGPSAPYKPTHLKHPCAIWTRASLENYEWLLRHGEALTLEYGFRYNRIHASMKVIRWCRYHYYRYLRFSELDLTPFALAMPDEFKVPGDAVRSYRNYYLGSKSRFAQWNRARASPEWWPT